MESSHDIQTVILKQATGSDIRTLCHHQVVYRSAHVGNLFSSNIVAGELGAKFMLFDRNTQKEDDNNHPSFLLIDRSFHRLGDEGFDSSFSPFVPFVNTGPATEYAKKYSLSPANFHLQQARRIFPGQVETQSEYFDNNRELIEKTIFTIMQKVDYGEFYSLFDRSMTYKGEPIKADNFDFFDRKKFIEKFFETNQSFINAANSGPENITLPENRTVPNLLFVAFMSILVEARKQYEEGKTDLSVVYHLSGPDMYKYITRVQDKINHLFGILKTEIDLPEKILFAVLPTAHLRLVTTKDRKSDLDNLINGLTIQKEANYIRKQNLPDMDAVSLMKSEAKRLVQDSNRVLKMDLKSKLSNHFNQHNLSSKEDIYVHPLLMSATGSELEEIYRQLSAIDSNK